MDDLEEIGIIQAVNNIVEAEVVEDLPPRIYHDRDDPFRLADRQFIRIFRLNKELAQFLIDLLLPFMEIPQRSSALNPTVKVLTALKFFASGSYQLDVGANINMAVSQPSVSRSVNEVVNILTRPEIFNEWVKFQFNIPNLNSIRNKFFNMTGFPGVVGAVDCTHVALVSPKTDDPLYPEHMYVNRKGYHSINVQLICDSDMKILNVNARYPGSTHDQYIWNNSNVREAMENLHRIGHTEYHLLGDSGYALRPWLLTPTEVQPPPDTNEHRYNACQRSTRSIVERCNGLLKMRFRCLLKDRVLHYTPETSSKIINACVVLHNMCLRYNVPEPEDDGEEINDLGMYNFRGDADVNGEGRVNPELAAGRRKQRTIIDGHFRG